MHHSGPVIDPAADSIEQKILQMEKSRDKPDFGHGYVEDKFAQSDNVNLSGPPIAAGWAKYDGNLEWSGDGCLYCAKWESSHKQVLGPD